MPIATGDYSRFPIEKLRAEYIRVLLQNSARIALDYADAIARLKLAGEVR